MNLRTNPTRFKTIKVVILLLFSFSTLTTAATNIALNKPTYAVSYYLDSKSEKAVDGDTTTAWNSGRYHPACLEIDLKGTYTIDSINVKLAQTPAGLTGFQAWTYSGDDRTIVARWVGITENGSWLRKGFDQPLQNIDIICICSENSPSWISFNEVVIIGETSKKEQPPIVKDSIVKDHIVKDHIVKDHIPLLNIQSLADSNQCFAMDIYKKLAVDSGNIIFSPYSISIAMGMTYGGARSRTKKEIAKVLHFLGNLSVHASFLRTQQTLDSLNDGKNQLLIANSIWPQKNHPFLPGYFDLLKTQYGVSVSYQDYANEPETARSKINTWVSERTKGNITDLIPQGMLGQSTKLVLTNATYYKAAWAQPFDRNRTEVRDFNTLASTTVRTEYMQNKEVFRYAETDEMQVLELPYSGRQLSMIILLPKINNFFAVESELSLAKLRQIINLLGLWKVRVAIPKFTMKNVFSLSNTLSSMGMPSAFSYGEADFSGMDGLNDLSISDVIHKAFIDVTEEGTVAAAATACVLERLSMTIEPEPKEFFADHPFVFIIRHNTTGNILFIGRLTNPKL